MWLRQEEITRKLSTICKESFVNTPEKSAKLPVKHK